MTYDPVDTNDDGVVDADVDNESVSTDDLTANNSATVSGPLDIAGTLDGDNLLLDTSEVTVDSTSETEIFDLPQGDTGILLVQKNSSGTGQFADLVLSGAGDSPEPTVVGTYERSTADGRTYTVDFNGKIHLQMSSTTIDVQIMVLTHQR